MESINDTLLQEVLFCDKVAIRADRKKLSFANRHRRNNIYLVSENGKYEYKFYLRQSEDFLEDFSVGLIWTNPANYIEISKSSVILLRCQGPHDGKEPLGSDIHHDYHIHTITLDEAIFYLINEYKVKNVESVVELSEEVDQTTLFEEV